MRLSTRTRYGMRLAIELASRYGEGPVFLKDIARNQQLSEKYLSQIILTLKSAGLVTSVRGAKGGYELTKSPAWITPREVYEAFEGSTDIVNCTLPGQQCSRSGECVAQDLWQSVSQAMREALESLSLQELLKQHIATHGGHGGLEYTI